MHVGSPRGIALIAVLLVSGLVFTIAVGLTLLLSVHHLAVRNRRESELLRFAAAAGVELAARVLADTNWDAALAGDVRANGSDGAPAGTRDLDGGVRVDLTQETHRLNCGSPLGCSDSQLSLNTLDRPWGVNNPRWQLFLFGPLSTFAPVQFTAPVYLLVWVADDGREVDGEPQTDGDAAGRGVLRVHAVALGRGRGRRGVEAELVRVCRSDPAAPGCEPGIRVQSWRDLHHGLP